MGCVFSTQEEEASPADITYAHGRLYCRGLSFHDACRKGETAVVKLLLNETRKRLEETKGKESAIISCLKLLESPEKSSGKTPLILARASGNAETEDFVLRSIEKAKGRRSSSGRLTTQAVQAVGDISIRAVDDSPAHHSSNSDLSPVIVNQSNSFGTEESGIEVVKVDVDISNEYASELRRRSSSMRGARRKGSAKDHSQLVDSEEPREVIELKLEARTVSKSGADDMGSFSSLEVLDVSVESVETGVSHKSVRSHRPMHSDRPEVVEYEI